jgi:hypothetical protein
VVGADITHMEPHTRTTPLPDNYPPHLANTALKPSIYRHFMDHLPYEQLVRLVQVLDIIGVFNL